MKTDRAIAFLGLLAAIVGLFIGIKQCQLAEVSLDEKKLPQPESSISTPSKKSLTSNSENIQTNKQPSSASTKPNAQNYLEPKTVELREEDFSSYINTSSNKSNIAVIIVDANGNISPDASSAIANIYKKSGKSTSTGLIRSIFLKKPEFEELKEGNSNIIERLKLKSYTDNLAIGKITYSIRKGTLVDETIVCTASISMSIISIINKSIEQSFTISNANGNGVTESQAQGNAFQKLLDKYFIERSSL